MGVHKTQKTSSTDNTQPKTPPAFHRKEAQELSRPWKAPLGRSEQSQAKELPAALHHLPYLHLSESPARAPGLTQSKGGDSWQRNHPS